MTSSISRISSSLYGSPSLETVVEIEFFFGESGGAGAGASGTEGCDVAGDLYTADAVLADAGKLALVGVSSIGDEASEGKSMSVENERFLWKGNELYDAGAEVGTE